MGWVVAHKTLLSAPVPIGIGIRGFGLGLDNTRPIQYQNVNVLVALVQNHPATKYAIIKDLEY